MEELLRQLKEKQSFYQKEILRLRESYKFYRKTIETLKKGIGRPPASPDKMHYDIDEINEHTYAKLLYFRECLKNVEKKSKRYNKQKNEVIRQINLILKTNENEGVTK